MFYAKLKSNLKFSEIVNAHNNELYDGVELPLDTDKMLNSYFSDLIVADDIHQFIRKYNSRLKAYLPFYSRQVRLISKLTIEAFFADHNKTSTVTNSGQDKTTNKQTETLNGQVLGTIKNTSNQSGTDTQTATLGTTISEKNDSMIKHTGTVRENSDSSETHSLSEQNENEETHHNRTVGLNYPETNGSVGDIYDLNSTPDVDVLNAQQDAFGKSNSSNTHKINNDTRNNDSNTTTTFGNNDATTGTSSTTGSGSDITQTQYGKQEKTDVSTSTNNNSSSIVNMENALLYGHKIITEYTADNMIDLYNKIQIAVENSNIYDGIIKEMSKCFTHFYIADDFEDDDLFIYY